MALAGKVGALLDKPLPFGVAGSYFAEDQGLYLATVCDNCLLTFLARAHAVGVEVEAIGRTVAGRLIFELPDSDQAVSLDALRAAHEGFFPALMEGEPALA
jgi:phosphoribosylformylglycinamidine synthase